MKTDRIFISLVILLLGVILVFSYAHAAPATTPKVTLPEISLATHAIGTSYHAMSVGIAKVVTERSPIKATVKPFSGPNAWMPLLNKGEMDVGMLSLVDATWAYTSGPGFPEKNPNLRFLLRVSPLDDSLDLVVRADSDIKRVRDLKGKRVAGDYHANRICHEKISAMLASGGLTWADVKKIPVPEIGTGLKLLREGQLDACFGASYPSAIAVETHAGIGIRVLSFEVSEEAVRKLETFVPSAEVGIMKAGVAPFIPEDVVNIWHWRSLAASAQLSEAAAYEFVKAIGENYKEIQPLHPALKPLRPETMLYKKPALPYHPGAIKYYKEKGEWTADLDRLQQHFLGR